MDNHSGRQRVLIVDDSPENIQVLMECLADEYATVAATDGPDALVKADSDPPPDIILLDIRMPGMDGYEVCTLLKGNSNLRDIPVIFLSVLESADGKVKAFKSGGVDYITKPFQGEEVQVRVRTHLMMRRLQLQLADQNHRLEQIVTKRTMELEKAYDRLSIIDRIKSDFLNMISHELRTPLNGILGISDLVFELCPPSSQRDEYRQYYRQSQERMEQLLEDSLLLNTIESSLRDVSRVSACLAGVLADAACSVDDVAVTVNQAEELSGAVICCDLELFKRALVILIKLAACFNSEGGRITMSASLQADTVSIQIPLDSFRHSKADAAGFFAITSNIRGNSLAQGLGLAPVVAERIITLSGGSVCLVKTADKDGVISLKLPVAFQNGGKDPLIGLHCAGSGHETGILMPERYNGAVRLQRA